MAYALRLAALSYAIGPACGRRPQRADRNAGIWGPAERTGDVMASNPSGTSPTPTPTPAPAPAADLQLLLPDPDLRKRDGDSRTTLCGYPADDLSSPAITCNGQSYCYFDRHEGVVGCCTEQDVNDCTLPSVCLESTATAQWSGDPATIYNSTDPEQPHCATYAYDANFYEPLYGASFLGCAAAGESGTIATTPLPGWNPPGEGTSTASSEESSATASSRTSSGGSTVTVTDGGASSSTATAASDDSSNSTNVGAIVGGVLGGVAGLGLITAALLFFILRRRKKKRAQEPAASLGRGDLSNTHMYTNEPPGSQYPSTFYGEAPPGMAQTTDQPFMAYPQDTYGSPPAVYARDDRSSRAPSFYTPGQPKRIDEAVSPIEPSPVSPVSPADNYNTMVSALTNPTPPPQSEYAPHSPPPPQQYQYYRPYPGT
ncbi:hypothetical protein F4780DRAFT_54739 [Xylariomycetidae sp. FL0641]|nr:hypothetical protein F4780DRAFT_54739 [Xylariomycetidae sp. FL0641]